MNTILNITKTELKTLFYSPIAWLILIIFTVQTNITFLDLFEGILKSFESGRPASDLTTWIFTYPRETYLFSNVQNNLFLYIPLLTMGLMSREISSGSIKLLFSSPISSGQIVFGKYLTMLLYGLILIGILSITVIFGNLGIQNLDIPYLLSGLLGIYLLICAYSAIGLFMSSLTPYQMVAAVSTLAVLAILNYVKTIGQDYEFVRELTYWLSISGRSGTFVSGMITSEDVAYFLIVIAMFLGFTIVKLEAGRIRKKFVNFRRYTLVILTGIAIGFVFSIPTIKSYLDVTATKRNTLSKKSQDIVKSIDGRLTITTYVNVLDNYVYYGMPSRIKNDMSLFDKYIRFKPDINLKYIYYWDKPTNNPNIYSKYPESSDKEIAEKICEIYNINFKKVLSPEKVENIGLSDEDNVFVRLVEHENGQKTFLRIFNDMRVMPDEREISAALKRVSQSTIKVGFLIGHGEREVFKSGDRDYSTATVLKNYRNGLINNGFDIENVDLTKSDIKKEIDILVLADVKTPLSEIENQRLDSYIERGGNILIAAEPKNREAIKLIVEPLGVQFKEGIIVERSKNFAPTLIQNNLTPKSAEKISYVFDNISKYNQKVTMLEGMGLEYSKASEKGFEVTPLLQTKWRGCWNELETTDFENQNTTLNTEIGEIEKPYEMAIAMSKMKAGKEQRIIVLGDADCFSNSEISMRREELKANNSAFLMGVFEWLSEGAYPIDVRKAEFQDTGFKIDLTTFKTWKFILMWLLPLSIIIIYFSIWFKRRKK
jgi:ABC-2 type transport system permease protein